MLVDARHHSIQYLVLLNKNKKLIFSNQSFTLLTAALPIDVLAKRTPFVAYPTFPMDEGGFFYAHS